MEIDYITIYDKAWEYLEDGYPDKAVRKFNYLIDNHHSRSAYDLAGLYSFGDYGIEKNPQKAILYYEKALFLLEDSDGDYTRKILAGLRKNYQQYLPIGFVHLAMIYLMLKYIIWVYSCPIRELYKAIINKFKR
jgi:tetratricopeptide (TPR) repeat protein